MLSLVIQHGQYAQAWDAAGRPPRHMCSGESPGPTCPLPKIGPAGARGLRRPKCQSRRACAGKFGRTAGVKPWPRELGKNELFRCLARETDHDRPSIFMQIIYCASSVSRWAKVPGGE
jgi:hypothetical protein